MAKTGEFQSVRLEHGDTGYELVGPSGGYTVVLIHGLTIPMFCWDGQVQELAGAGLRVLRYDQYGRGRSDAPDVSYNRSLYREQLRQLLDALHITTPVGLVGHSFGAAVAADFTVEYPQMVGRIVFISPYIAPPGHRVYMSLMKIPGVGEWLMRNKVMPMARKRGKELLEGFRADSEPNLDPDLPNVEEYARMFFDQLDDPDFFRRFLSMFRSDAVAPYHDRYRAVEAAGMDCMLVWGDQDKDVPPERIQEVKGLLLHANFRVFPGVGHSPYLERREECNEMLIDFFS